MARPQKPGLDYFPLDVDFFEDDKILLISAEFGIKSEVLILRLLAKIYREGYFYKWGDDQCLLMSKSMGMAQCSKGWIEEVIKGLIRRTLFDRDCFNRHSVLTSSAIQRRYIQAKDDRKKFEGDRPYWLLASKTKPPLEDNPQINGSSPEINDNSPPINPQSKVKESRVKKSIVEKSKAEEITPPTPENEMGESVDFLKFQTWIDHTAPRVNQMREPFTQLQFEEVIRCYPSKGGVFVKELLRDMHDYESLFRSRSSSAVFKRWAVKRLPMRAEIRV